MNDGDLVCMSCDSRCGGPLLTPGWGMCRACAGKSDPTFAAFRKQIVDKRFAAKVIDRVKRRLETEGVA